MIKGKEYYVYILRLSNDSLYTGYTCDVSRRVRAHGLGKGSKCVRSFPPVRVERVWKTESKSSALRLEAMVKRCSRDEKELFIRKPAELSREVRRTGGIGGSIRVMRKFAGVPVSEDGTIR